MNISVWAPDIKSQVHLPRCVQTITSNTRPEAMQLYLLSISAKKNLSSFDSFAPHNISPGTPKKPFWIIEVDTLP